jgi:SAM-dependent methyltransferase
MIHNMTEDPGGAQPAWFEELYQAAEAGTAVVPWDDHGPNPRLTAWAAGSKLRGTGKRAVVVGCGLGDDAEYLAALGFQTTAFDVAPSALRGARQRFPESTVDYEVADLLDPPVAWRGAFDLVFEANTLQVLRGATRARAIAQTAGLVAPGGTVLVIARARESEEPSQMPWPLTRADLDGFTLAGLTAVRIEDFDDSAEPPRRRWRAQFTRSPQ